MRGAPPLQCAVGYATALPGITHIVLSYSRDDNRVAGRALSKLVFVAYAEEYLVDVKFVRDRIGTVLFDHLVDAGGRPPFA